MNKLILIAVAGLCFGNIYAKNPKKDKAEEGFVFTTVKEKHAGHSPALDSWNQNCCVKEKENSTFLKCL